MYPSQMQYIEGSKSPANFASQSLATNIPNIMPQQSAQQRQTIAQTMAMINSLTDTPQQNASAMQYGGQQQGGMPGIPVGTLMQALGGNSGTVASGTASSSGASGFMGTAGSALASNPIGWLLAAAAVPTVGSLASGNSPTEVFGGEGWGGPPMQAAQDAIGGDFGGAAENVLGGAPGTNMIAPLVNGGNLEDVGKNMIAPVANLTQDGNFFQNLIQAIANPFQAR